MLGMATDSDTAPGPRKHSVTSNEALRHWHFNFSVIDNPVRLNESFALRFEVYCKERQFLPSENYPSKLEIDSYDRYAIHIGGTNQDNLMIGTVRLVLPSSIGFPLFEHCELFPEYQYLCGEKLQHTSGEISRLAISRLYRRRLNDGLYGLAYKNDGIEVESGVLSSEAQQLADQREDRRTKPEIILGLYKEMYQTSKRQGITHWFVAMEKTLQRLLHRFSFDFTPIGPELDYYGPVTPYIAVISEIEETVYRKNPDLFMDFMSGLEPEFLPEFARKLL
jgi:N-acyl amino acid synthase of PEP-CTERM/exosortase system